MAHVNELVVSYLAAWNEPRRALVAKTWTDGGTYVDAHRAGSVTRRSTHDDHYLGGTDFAVVAEDGRFASVTGFTDAAPAR